MSEQPGTNPPEYTMATDAHLNDSINRALTATTVAERTWWKAHVNYLLTAAVNRPIYRALRAEAPMVDAAFDAATRAEIDEDVAADDSGEWVRAARVVLAWALADLEAAEDAGPSAADQDAAYRQAMWYRACDAQLDHPTDW